MTSREALLGKVRSGLNAANTAAAGPDPLKSILWRQVVLPTAYDIAKSVRESSTVNPGLKETAKRIMWTAASIDRNTPLPRGLRYVLPDPKEIYSPVTPTVPRVSARQAAPSAGLSSPLATGGREATPAAVPSAGLVASAGSAAAPAAELSSLLDTGGRAAAPAAVPSAGLVATAGSVAAPAAEPEEEGGAGAVLSPPPSRTLIGRPPVGRVLVPFDAIRRGDNVANASIPVARAQPRGFAGAASRVASAARTAASTFSRLTRKATPITTEASPLGEGGSLWGQSTPLNLPLRPDEQKREAAAKKKADAEMQKTYDDFKITLTPAEKKQLRPIFTNAQGYKAVNWGPLSEKYRVWSSSQNRKRGGGRSGRKTRRRS